MGLLAILMMIVPYISYAQSQESPVRQFRTLNDQGAYLKGDWNSPSSFNEAAGDLESSLDESLNANELALHYMTSEEKLKDGHFILKAYVLAPYDKSIWEEVMEYYGIIGDDASVKVMADKIEKAGLIPDRILDFHKLLVSQVQTGSVVLSHGEWDTAALQIAIAAKNKKVSVINIHWLREQAFLDDALSRYNLARPIKKERASDLIKDLINKNSNVNIHLTLSQNHSLLEGLGDRLKLEGLAFRIDGEAQAEQLQIQCWKELKSKLPFKDMSSDSRVTRFELNYLPILSSMENYSLLSGNKADADWARSWMNTLTQRASVPNVPISSYRKN